MLSGLRQKTHSPTVKIDRPCLNQNNIDTVRFTESSHAKVLWDVGFCTFEIFDKCESASAVDHNPQDEDSDALSL